MTDPLKISELSIEISRMAAPGVVERFRAAQPPEVGEALTLFLLAVTAAATQLHKDGELGVVDLIGRVAAIGIAVGAQLMAAGIVVAPTSEVAS